MRKICYGHYEGDDGEYLKLDPDLSFGWKDAELSAKDAAKVRPELLHEMLDHDAANKNQHAFCGTHKALWVLLLKIQGRENAFEAMWAIARRGGLHGLEENRNE